MKTKHIVYLVIVIVVILFIYNQTKSKENLLIDDTFKDSYKIHDILYEMKEAVTQNATGTFKYEVPVEVRGSENNMSILFKKGNELLQIIKTSDNKFFVSKTFTSNSGNTSTVTGQNIDITLYVNKLKQKGYTVDAIGFGRAKYILNIKK